MKLSIITVNLNNASGLQKTIESVVNQTSIDFEYIIIDGGSTDGSTDIIKKNSEKITYWVSEPDNGIYNAMNKGITKATGEYCLFLNSGDWLYDNDVTKDFISSGMDDDIICGDILLWNNGSKMLREAIDKEELGFEHFYSNRLPHQSTFIKRNLFLTYGFYNEKLKIVADWEFFLKCLLLNNSRYNKINRIVSYYDLSGVSSQAENFHLQELERKEVFDNYFPRVYKSYEKLVKKLETIETIEKDYREYINLKNGRLGFFVTYLRFLKKLKKQLTK